VPCEPARGLAYFAVIGGTNLVFASKACGSQWSSRLAIFRATGVTFVFL
jgi:hypothetical protein